MAEVFTADRRPSPQMQETKLETSNLAPRNAGSCSGGLGGQAAAILSLRIVEGRGGWFEQRQQLEDDGEKPPCSIR